MDTNKEKLKLEENVAAVRLATGAVEDDITGVAIIIPAGEVIQFDRASPLVGRMRQVEWKGLKYGVFPQDLLDRASKPASHRQENPGIVPIHSAPR